jgi:hypothetical protein
MKSFPIVKQFLRLICYFVLLHLIIQFSTQHILPFIAMASKRIVFRFLHRIARIEPSMPIKGYQPAVYTHFLLRRSFSQSENHQSITSKVKNAWKSSKTVWYPMPIALGLSYIALQHLYKVPTTPPPYSSL